MAKRSNKEQKAIEKAVFDSLKLDCEDEDFNNTQAKPFFDAHASVKDFFEDYLFIQSEASLVQFMVKLYFLSQGHEKYLSVLPDRWEQVETLNGLTNRYYAQSRFEITIPWCVLMPFEGKATYCDTSIERTIDEYCAEDVYTVTTAGCKSPEPSPEDKITTAVELFCAIANSCTSKHYCEGKRSDGVGVSIGAYEVNAALNVALDMLMDGKIRPCPHCYDPVYKPRSNSTPFCSDSCQQRYRETAMKMVKAGIPCEQTIKACPHMKPETIREFYLFPEKITV